MLLMKRQMLRKPTNKETIALVIAFVVIGVVEIKPNELILSMQEIADKFGVDVETLKIKK